MNFNWTEHVKNIITLTCKYIENFQGQGGSSKTCGSSRARNRTPTRVATPATSVTYIEIINEMFLHFFTLFY